MKDSTIVNYYASCEELTHWKRLWCWEGLGAGGEGDDRGWDGWMASLNRWTWVWVNSGSWWWTGRPGMLRFVGSQRVGHDWATELNWLNCDTYNLGAWRRWECPCWLISISFPCGQMDTENQFLNKDSLRSMKSEHQIKLNDFKGYWNELVRKKILVGSIYVIEI